MKMKEENEKVGLKLNNQKTKIMASSPITSWEIDGETVETVAEFILGGSKITVDGDCSHEIKRRLLLGRKVITNLDSILKSRDITLPTKVRLVKAMVFPVVMLDMRVGLWRKLSAKELMLLNCGVGKDSWESPGLHARRSNQSILKEISPEYSLEGLMLKLKLQYFGHLMRRADSLEKTLILGGIGGRRRGWKRMRWLDGITDSMEMSSSELGSWWWTGRPGVLRFTGSQSRTWLSDWTELNWMVHLNIIKLLQTWSQYICSQVWLRPFQKFISHYL